MNFIFQIDNLKNDRHGMTYISEVVKVRVKLHNHK